MNQPNKSWRYRFYRSFFSEKINIHAEQQALLKAIFPKLDWQKVTFREGLPWFAQRSFAVGMALPAALSRQGTAIHFAGYHTEHPFSQTVLLVHEAFHIQQYHDLRNRWIDFGYFRRFMRYYIGWYLAGLWQHRRTGDSNQKAYRLHPIEVPAYHYEELFVNCYADFRRLPLAAFLQQHTQLICLHSGSIARPPQWAWALGSLIALLIATVIPLTKALVGSVAWLLTMGGR